MEKLFVQTSTHPYFIYTEEDIRFSITELLPKNYSSYFIITDDVVAKLYLDDCLQNFSQDQQVAHSIIPHGEQTKSVDTYYQLLTDALSYGLDRQSLIIALGGGVVGDIAGFVAATFMRGVDYIQMPTTILAHDSSVGGKVAINHELGKNLIGSFYPPKAVIYDTATLTTLAAREVRSGYAELMKEALIRDESFFHDLLGTSLAALTNDQLVSHLQSGMAIKAEIVEADERESGIRKHLNLGHTLGHALEAELGYGKLTHGEAVAIGMLFALRVSEKLFSINLPYDELYNWLEQNHYPLTLKRLNPDLLLRKMKSDKKSVHNKVHMVLVKQIGQIQDVEVPDQDLALLLDTFLRELVIE
ncbi:3-dehydroquinate synthase [Lentibacillus populi]|uniref:3-dehydroquinate synthase n=1 Tax=Lentibacillus populi TaxID=1827502 RepID=A0A9W5TVI8_9BACI|nr:3-dehydroquinate synthase [Lentibacillus populi]GGB33468.1 3-dehydroquinate synthase [Lentibacillus populi]